MNLAEQAQAGREWTDLNMECWNASSAHTEYIVLRCFVERVKELETDSAVSSLDKRDVAGLRKALKKLCDLVNFLECIINGLKLCYITTVNEMKSYVLYNFAVRHLCSLLRSRFLPFHANSPAGECEIGQPAPTRPSQRDRS